MQINVNVVEEVRLIHKLVHQLDEGDLLVMSELVMAIDILLDEMEEARKGENERTKPYSRARQDKLRKS